MKTLVAQDKEFQIDDAKLNIYMPLCTAVKSQTRFITEYNPDQLKFMVEFASFYHDLKPDAKHAILNYEFLNSEIPKRKKKNQLNCTYLKPWISRIAAMPAAQVLAMLEIAGVQDCPPLIALFSNRVGSDFMSGKESEYGLSFGADSDTQIQNSAMAGLF